MDAPDPQHLALRIYPDPILREKCRPVDFGSADVPGVAARMLEIMHESRGIGLAAPQVGLSWRMFVAEVPADPDDPEENVDPSRGPISATTGAIVAVNPELVEPSRSPTVLEEGCLSLPEIRGDVSRPDEVTLRAFDAEGRAFEVRAAGLLAKCVQHEYDHIEGVLILDRMSQMSRLKVRSAVRALERDAGG